MILQSLYEYYQRKASDPESHIAPEGWEWKPIPFIVDIDSSGNFLQLRDTRENVGKKRVAKQYLVPRGMGRSGSDSWKTANLFWDHYGYILGCAKDDSEKSKEMGRKQLISFVKRLQELPDKVKRIPDVVSVLNFYKNKEYSKVPDVQIKECQKMPGCNLVFSVGGKNILTEISEVKAYVDSVSLGNISDNDNDEESSVYEAVCLITGQKGPIQRKHARTPISKDTKSLVAIQKNSGYDSYGKEQAFNCPVSPSAEFAYTTALNTLIKSESNRIRIADMTIVFWAQKQSRGYDFESDFSWYFKTDKDDPDRGVKAVKGLYDAVHGGRFPLDEGNRFYVLGLAPNSARISVRFWKTGTIRDFAGKIKQHFDDFQIVHGPKEPEHLSLYQILSSTALEYKMENVPPNLAGAVITSMLDGTPYPITLLHQCVRRIRAEQQVNRARASILKAYINRFHNPKEKEVIMALDRSNINVGYRLGRLFAVLEKIQEESSPGINATIRDRFYGAVSTTPITVFPQLLKLKNHHLAKLNPGRKVNFEKEIAEIFDELKDDLPAHLTLDLQARFAVGYYHQRQDFFKKKDTTNK